MHVPLADPRLQLEPIRAEIDAAIARVVDSGHFILGPEVEAFEAEIAEYLGCRHAIGVSSGTDALLVALMALGVGPGDEVITAAFSFFATAGCIARLGARPVFVDIDPATFNIDASRIEPAVTPRTKAVIPVHLFGQPADMEPVLEIARRHDLYVVEDAAQALGARCAGRAAGTLGDFGCFSFFPTKNLGAMGDAGMAVTNDDELAARVRMLRGHGFAPKYHARRLGGNFRLDALQAAVLRVKLGQLDGWNETRRGHAARYRAEFGKRITGGTADGGITIRLPEASAASDHVYHQFTIRAAADRRDAMQSHLAERGIASEVYYPVPLHLQECFVDFNCRKGDFPHSELAAAEVLSLPVFAEMTVEQQDHVIDAVCAFS